MTKPAPFTQASIRRVIEAARKAGLRVTGIRPDGTVLVEDGGLTPSGDVAGDESLPPSDSPFWDDVGT